MRPSGRPLVWEFVVDAADHPSHIGDKCDVSPFIDTQLGLVEPSASRSVSRDKSGNWISGFAPLLDSDNRPVAVLGVVVSADDLIAEMAGMRRAGFLCAGLAVLLSVILGMLITERIMSPASKLIERIRAAGRGDLETPLNINSSDEIGDIARTFDDMVASLRESRDKLASQVNIDFLTGLYNHQYFLQRLENEVKRAERYGRNVSLLMLDLDKFKLVNGRYGHLAGDEVLKQVGGLLADVARDTDVVARYGGEEFAVILPETVVDSASEIAENVRRAVENHDFSVPVSDSHGRAVRAQIHVTVCIGLASYPIHSAKADGLLMAADVALYHAKYLGGNRVYLYGASPQEGDSDPYELYTFIRKPSLGTVQTLAAAVDARDHYTQYHSDNVAKYSLMLGQSLGLDEEDLEILRTAALLHDVGKIGIPDHILNKPGDLTDEERAVIKIHPSVGVSIVRNTPTLDTTLPAIQYHHECYDGTGYPEGLRGEEIPLLARIIAIADAFDALTTDRPYRPAFPLEDATRELRRSAGRQFDPEFVEVFVTQIEQLAAEQRLAA